MAVEDDLLVRLHTTRPKLEVIEQATRVHEDAGGLFATTLRNQHFGSATLHMFSLRLDGSYVTELVNTGRLPLFGTRASEHAVTSERGSVFQGGQYGIGRLGRGATQPLQVGWSVQGPFSVLWALAQIFFTGAARVTEHMRVQARRYDASHDMQAVVPVRSVSVAWD